MHQHVKTNSTGTLLKEFIGNPDPMPFPFAKSGELAKMVRPLLPRGRAVLYHGTRYPSEILHDNALRIPEPGISAVSFTRQLHVAIYWSQLKRGHEHIGAVFVLDRDRLRSAFRLEPFRDAFWDDEPERRDRKSSEAEEQVFGRDVIELDRFLVDVVWVFADGTVHSIAWVGQT